MRVVALTMFGVFGFGQTWDNVTFELTGTNGAFSGGTLTWADVDGDGDFDVFADSGGFWLNNILDFTQRSDVLSSSGGAWSAAFGDYNNDGKPDLHLGFGGGTPNRILENQFPTFTNVTASLNYDDPEWVQPVFWGDYNNDGFLDIYSTHENPMEFHKFWQNLPGGFVARFEPGGSPDPFGLADLNSHSYGLTWGDIDIDGDIDIVTSACGGGSGVPGEEPHNKVYENRTVNVGGGFFDRYDDVTQNSGVGSAGEAAAGSADYWATLFDYDGDEFPDLFIGDNGGDHRLWRNTGVVAGDFRFELIDSSIHGLAGGGAFGHAAVAGDYDNDGDLDLYITVSGLFSNQGDGSFADLNHIPSTSSFNDAVWVDWDMDGDLDLCNQQAIYENPGNSNNWIAIELIGDPSQGTTKSAHNVKIRVTSASKVQHREHRYQVGSYSQHMLPTHFGLGPDEMVQEIRVTWPNGSTTTFNNVPSNQYITLEQSANCSGTITLNSSNYQFYFPGEPDAISLDITPSEPKPIAWRVLEGGSYAPSQFTDASANTTGFEAYKSTHYVVSASYLGCVGTAFEVLVQSADEDGDGDYDFNDWLLFQERWQTAFGEQTIDLNQDGAADVLDLTFLVTQLPVPDPKLAQK